MASTEKQTDAGTIFDSRAFIALLIFLLHYNTLLMRVSTKKQDENVKIW